MMLKRSVFEAEMSSMLLGMMSRRFSEDPEKCPKCGSTRLGGDVIANATEDCDEVISIFCQDCGYKLVGTPWDVSERWSHGEDSDEFDL